MAFKRKPGPSMGDNLKGLFNSLKSGHAMNPAKSMKHIRNAQADRLAYEETFGDGETPGNNRKWHPPVYATLDNGRPITISFAKAKKNEFLVADGHIPMSKFFSTAKPQSHDHFAGGRIVADRGASS